MNIILRLIPLRLIPQGVGIRTSLRALIHARLDDLGIASLMPPSEESLADREAESS